MNVRAELARPAQDVPLAVAARRHLDRAAWALIGCATVLHGWAAGQGWYFWDDFLFSSDAYGRRLDLAYLTQGHDGHLMPGGILWVWLQTRAAPMDHTALVSVQTVLFAATSIAAYRMLRYVFGARAAIFVPLAFLLFSPLTLTVFLWWSAALNHQPLELAMILGIHSYVHHLRTGSRPAVLGAVLACILGMAFSEKGILLPVLLVAIATLWFTPGRPLSLIPNALRAHWRSFGLLGSLAIAYVVLYLSLMSSPSTPKRATPGLVADYAQTALTQTLIPSLFGGPWTWVKAGGTGLAATPGPAAWIAGAVLLGVLVETVRRLPNAWRAWTLVIGYLTLDVLLVAIGRLTFAGPLLGREGRYVADAAVPIALAMGYVVVEAIDQYKARHATLPVWTPTVAALLLGAFVVSAGYSTKTQVDIWRENPARAYFTNAQIDILARDGVNLYDDAVPADILWAIAYPANKQSNLLRPFRVHPHWDGVEQPLLMLDSQGRVRRLAVPDQARSIPGPVAGCGYFTSGGSVYLPLETRTVDWRWVVNLAYFTDHSFEGRVTAGRTTQEVEFRPGLNNMDLVIEGPIEGIAVSDLPGNANICFTTATVGIPQPVPGDVP